ncbi:MAG: FAD:protein FMN transferase [Vicinamibacterales bacterium]
MLHERHFRAMNTDVGVWLWSTAPDRAKTIGRSLEWAEGVFARVEDELSRFRSTSALSRLNQAAGRGPQAVSPLLWTVLMSALQAADDSGGIYDPTLLRTLERIGYDRSFERIQVDCAVEAIVSEPAFCSWRRVRLDDATRSVSLPADLALDFGGIAKGWTVDRVARALAPLGPVLVDAGGDLRVIGAVGGEGWPIAVQDAFEPERDRTVVCLREGALATSSIGGRQWHRGGRMLHHIIDPRTGTAAASDLHSVTVRAPSAAIADVAAKVVLVLGGASGTSYLLERGLSGLLTPVQGREMSVGTFRQEEMEHHASVHST